MVLIGQWGGLADPVCTYFNKLAAVSGRLSRVDITMGAGQKLTASQQIPQIAIWERGARRI